MDTERDEPTLFEWAGGFPALRRMTHIVYEKHVPEDPLLALLFADMPPDRPERVAAWFGEVFGGPERYTEGYGGYDRMVSQHLGRDLSEDQRARWASLMNSQPGAEPPRHMPVPRWWWVCDATPGSRVSVLTTDRAVVDEGRPLPGLDEEPASRPMSSRCSGPRTARRCASRSISGPTTT